MTKINVKLLTTSTTVIDGAPGDYSVKTVSHTIDPKIKKPINRETRYKYVDELAKELAAQIAKTIMVYYNTGHIFNITIKDFLKTPEQ